MGEYGGGLSIDEPFEVSGEFVSVCVPHIGIFSEALFHHIDAGFAECGAELPQRGQWMIAVGMEYSDLVFAVERRAAGEQMEESGPEGVDIGAGVCGLAAALLR